MKEQSKSFDKIQKQQKFSPGSDTFWKCFRLSKDILFVDKFFNEYGYRRMIWELKNCFKARDKSSKFIQIYCLEENYIKLQRLHNESKIENEKLLNFFSVTIKQIEMQNSTHDRFAIMDKEIWHCGAAIGGMHGALSALSRGWKDENDCLKKYFCGE